MLHPWEVDRLEAGLSYKKRIIALWHSRQLFSPTHSTHLNNLYMSPKACRIHIPTIPSALKDRPLMLGEDTIATFDYTRLLSPPGEGPNGKGAVGFSKPSTLQFGAQMMYSFKSAFWHRGVVVLWFLGKGVKKAYNAARRHLHLSVHAPFRSRWQQVMKK